MKIRKQTFSLDQYLKLMKSEVIRSDQDCQRMSGQWTANMVNELIFTVLTDDYIPPIILGEEISNGITKQWIIDGLQRSSTLSMFRYGNTKITSNIDEHMVAYQKKVLDESGNPVRDDQGELVWESAECDIRNKTYGQLPEQLRDRFDGYQLEVAVHQNCDTTQISRLVRKYNNHVSMNSAQKSFTYIDAFAREIREITEDKFFQDVYSSSQKGKINGTFERIVGDIVILCNYPDKYRKDTKMGFKWLNENATLYDFESTKNLLARLNASIEPTKEIRGLFNAKNTHVFVAAFKAFTESGRKDTEFNGFLSWLINGGNETKINGISWNDLDMSHSTRDSSVVHGKIDHLKALAEQYSMENQKAA